jgi:hypothetical protein
MVRGLLKTNSERAVHIERILTAERCRDQSGDDQKRRHRTDEVSRLPVPAADGIEYE